MSQTQSQIDTWLTTPKEDNVNRDPDDVRFPAHDWTGLTPIVRRLTAFEQLTGTKGVRERQHEQTARLVHDTGKETVMRATADGHDYSDCGGDNQ